MSIRTFPLDQLSVRWDILRLRSRSRDCATEIKGARRSRQSRSKLDLALAALLTRRQTSGSHALCLRDRLRDRLKPFLDVSGVFVTTMNDFKQACFGKSGDWTNPDNLSGKCTNSHATLGMVTWIDAHHLSKLGHALRGG